MDTLPFNFIWLGQTILKYQVPLDVFNTLNGIYETNFVNLPDAHKQLVGKIHKKILCFLVVQRMIKCINIICCPLMCLTGLKVYLNTI